MLQNRGNPPGRSERAVLALFIAVAALLVLALLAEGGVRLGAIVALALVVAWLLVGDFLLALSDERAVRRNPHDNRVSDVGRTVRVLEDFTRRSGGSSGKVSLAGETWKARSRDGTLHRAGEELVVIEIERLVLVVARRRGE